MKLAFLLLLVFFVVWSFFADNLPKKYTHRICSGRKWRQCFPKIKKEEIRRFLQIFIDSFLIKDKHRLKFKPDDKVMDIYRAINKYSTADAMETETLVMSLESEYSVELPSYLLSEKVTLGELFAFVTEKSGLTSEEGNC